MTENKLQELAKSLHKGERETMRDVQIRAWRILWRYDRDFRAMADPKPRPERPSIKAAEMTLQTASNY